MTWMFFMEEARCNNEKQEYEKEESTDSSKMQKFSNSM